MTTRDKITALVNKAADLLVGIDTLPIDQVEVCLDEVEVLGETASNLVNVMHRRELELLRRWEELTKGGKMSECVPVCHAESSITERVAITNQLEEMAEVVRHLDMMPIREALATLDAVIRDCEGVLTLLNDLKEWANQPTKGVNIPF